MMIQTLRDDSVERSRVRSINITFPSSKNICRRHPMRISSISRPLWRARERERERERENQKFKNLGLIGEEGRNSPEELCNYVYTI